MELPLPVSERREIVARAFQAAASLEPNTLESAIASLEAQYRIQIGERVPLSARRDAVASLIDSSLPSDVQDQISDAAVIAVFSDLVRAGLVEIEVAWIEDVPPENLVVEPPVTPEA